MKEMYLFSFYILLSTVLSMSYASTRYVLINNLDLNRTRSSPNSDPLGYYNNFGIRTIPATESGVKNMGTYNQEVKNSGNVWQFSTGNGPAKGQLHLFKEPLVIPNRGFPISSVYFNLVKGTHEIATEVPVNPDNISFGPSASHIGTAPIRHRQPDGRTPNHNTISTRGHGHFYKTVDTLNPQEGIEVTSEKITTVENIPAVSSSATIPPAPTLSPWIDGFGK